MRPCRQHLLLNKLLEFINRYRAQSPAVQTVLPGNVSHRHKRLYARSRRERHGRIDEQFVSVDHRHRPSGRPARRKSARSNYRPGRAAGGQRHLSEPLNPKLRDSHHMVGKHDRGQSAVDKHGFDASGHLHRRKHIHRGFGKQRMVPVVHPRRYIFIQIHSSGLHD